MGIILGNVLSITRKRQYNSFIFGGSTILVKHIYGGNFVPKVLKGWEMVLFPDYIKLDGIAGFRFFFHFILEFYCEFVTCPFTV